MKVRMTRCAVAIGIAAFVVAAVSMAKAGGAGDGSMGTLGTNPGGKYIYRGGAMSTNPDTFIAAAMRSSTPIPAGSTAGTAPLPIIAGDMAIPPGMASRSTSLDEDCETLTCRFSGYGGEPGYADCWSLSDPTPPPRRGTGVAVDCTRHLKGRFE
jgi:hypothetical protein